MDFQGKNVLVLGGTGDIGSAVAEAFQKEGARVCVHGSTRGTYQADVTNKEALQTCLQKVLTDVGTVDILVNAVSAQVENALFEKKTWDDFKHHLDVQLQAAVESIQTVLPGMKEKKCGRIVHILSTYVDGTVPARLSDYVSAKYALLGLTKALAKEVASFGITVNAVSPSFIKNEFTKKTPNIAAEMIAHTTPLKRLATEEDVAGAVLYLAHDNASFVTGTNIQVNGGQHL